MKDQFVKRFESLSEDFIYYMRSVEHLKDNTVQNYISWLKFLSESYPIDEKIEEKDIIKILEQEKKSCLERSFISFLHQGIMKKIFCTRFKMI